jgi:NADPH-dependent ferric siderophore reductase
MPAINSVLDAIGDIDAHLYLEWVHASDTGPPLRTRAGDRVTWVERGQDGRALVDAVRSDLAQIGAADELFGWAAGDSRTTRELARAFREFGIPKARIKAMGYWRA